MARRDNNNLVFDWFDDKFISFQNIVRPPDFFKTAPIPPNYENVLHEFSSCYNSSKNDLIQIQDHGIDPEVDKKDEMIRTHRYKLSFTDDQIKILTGYFNECTILYNLCVDIWKKYNDVTDSWQLLKDIIFKHKYRSNKSYSHDQLIDLIINELKEINRIYIESRQDREEEYLKQRQIKKEEYLKKLEEWKEKKAKVIKSGFTFKLKKPAIEKVKLPNPEKPRKPRGINIKKPAPDESLKGIIKLFCTHLSTNRDLKTLKKDFVFEMKHKNTKKSEILPIGMRNISENGIFVNSLGKKQSDEFSIVAENYDFDHDCSLIHDKVFNEYYFNVTFRKEILNKTDRKLIVALDPGERIFFAFYALEEYGKLGCDMRIRILKARRLISKIQRILDRRENRNGKRIKNRTKLKKKINRMYERLKGYVNEMHKKVANFLCENYENIILPDFKTKPMISKNKEKGEMVRIKKIVDDDERRREYLKLRNGVRLSGDVKFVLQMQSHNSFKKYLKAKAKEYGTTIYNIDESYTSQACTFCGRLGKEYDNDRMKICECGKKINRDVNGSRNILMKALRILYKRRRERNQEISPGIQRLIATLKARKAIKSTVSIASLNA